MLAVRFLRASLSTATSTSAATSFPSRIHRFGRIDCFHTRVKSEGLKYLEGYGVQKFSCQSFVFRRFCQNAQRLWNSGRIITAGSMMVCAAVGSSMSLSTQKACCADGSSQDSQAESWVSPHHSERRFSHAILLMHKLMVPLFLVFTLWTKWGQTHPLFLTARVLLIFVCTKPVPSSIYIFVDRLRYQIMSQQPLRYKYQTLHASKVEVDDYTLFCLAKVHIKNETLVVAGFLGGWWMLPFSSWDEVLLFNKFSWKVKFSLDEGKFRLAIDTSWY